MMIEHKRIKAICAVVLSALVAVSMAVPCFATEDLTDFNDWLILATVTHDGVENSMDLTNTTTREGFSFTTPSFSSSNMVSQVKFYIYPLGNNENIYLENLSFNAILYAYSGNVNGPVSLLSTSMFDVRRYRSGVSGSDRLFSSYFSSNPNAFTYFPSSSQNVGVIVLTFNFTATYGYFNLNITDFYINGDTTGITLGNAGDDLLNLAEDLSVPTPNIDVGSIVDDALSGADTESVGEVWSFMSNDLITKMLLIVVSFALLGYILYGKKEAGN